MIKNHFEFKWNFEQVQAWITEEKYRDLLRKNHREIKNNSVQITVQTKLRQPSKVTHGKNMEFFPVAYVLSLRYQLEDLYSFDALSVHFFDKIIKFRLLLKEVLIFNNFSIKSCLIVTLW